MGDGKFAIAAVVVTAVATDLLRIIILFFVCNHASSINLIHVLLFIVLALSLFSLFCGGTGNSQTTNNNNNIMIIFLSTS